MNKIDFTIKAFCFAGFYRLPRAFFLFLDEKKQKSSQPNDNTPFGSGTLMELSLYCKLNICSLMMNENNHRFNISKT